MDHNLNIDIVGADGTTVKNVSNDSDRGAIGFLWMVLCTELTRTTRFEDDHRINLTSDEENQLINAVVQSLLEIDEDIMQMYDHLQIVVPTQAMVFLDQVYAHYDLFISAVTAFAFFTWVTPERFFDFDVYEHFHNLLRLKPDDVYDKAEAIPKLFMVLSLDISEILDHVHTMIQQAIAYADRRVDFGHTGMRELVQYRLKFDTSRLELNIFTPVGVRTYSAKYSNGELTVEVENDEDQYDTLRFCDAEEPLSVRVADDFTNMFANDIDVETKDWNDAMRVEIDSRVIPMLIDYNWNTFLKRHFDAIVSQYLRRSVDPVRRSMRIATR